MAAAATAEAPADAAGEARRAWLVLATVMVGTLLVGLDRTIINLAIPEIINDFGVSVSTAGWLGTAYIISDAVFIPMFAKLADIVGDRRIHLFGLVGFLFTSVLCGLAPSFAVLVAFRAVQGFVGAAVFPTALSLIARHFTDPRARTQAYGIWSAAFAVSIALGPLVGGPLIDNLDWRWIFYINFPICLLAMFMLGRFVPLQNIPFRIKGFDWLGAALVGVALTAGCIVIERGEQWGWSSPGALLAYVVTVGFAVAFVAYERRVPDPVVAPGIFRSRVLVSALLISFATFASMVGTMFLVPVFAQQFLGYEATGTGFLLLPFALALVVASGIGSSLRISPRIIVGVGVAISGVGMLGLTQLDVRSDAVEVWFPLVLVATGLGLNIATLTTAATTGVDPSDYGMASGVLNLTRNMAAAIGIALFGTLLNRYTEDRVLELAEGTVVNDPGMRDVVPGLIIFQSQVDAYAGVFLVSAGLMFVGALLALTLRESRSAPA